MSLIDPKALYASDDVSWLEHASDRKVEGQWVERKQWCDAREIARQISGFANGLPPGGLFVLGVDPQGKILGLSQQLPAVNARLAQLPGLVEDCTWSHRFVPVGGGKDQILFVFVPFSAKRVVCLADGQTAFKRMGDTTQQLSIGQLVELRYSRQERQFEDEPAVEYVQGSLDQDLADEFLAAIKARNGLTMPVTLDGALKNRHLLVENEGRSFLTFAGLLALGKDPAHRVGGARLRFLRFDGKDERVGTERNVVKDRWFDGPIPRIVEAFREFMRTQVREFDFLGPDGKFLHEAEYPETVWEEAVVNALVHRSYSLSNQSVFVRMFDDRLVVENPGAFPQPGFDSPIDPDRIPSNPRNPHLCQALQYLELVRLQQEGTRRMKQDMERVGLPPPIIEERDGGSVRATIVNDIDRRRARDGSDDLVKTWETIVSGLSHPYAIVRRNAVLQWGDLRGKRAIPPREAIDAALRVIDDPDVHPDEKADLVQAIDWPLAPERLVDLAGVLTRGRAHGDARLGRLVTSRLSASDEAIEQIMEWLEHPPTGAVDDIISWAFLALNERLGRFPLPRQQTLDRMLTLAERHMAVSGVPAFYERITGRKPTR